MRSQTFLFLLLFFITGLSAQQVGIFNYEEIKTMEDAWGRPIRPQTTYQVEGSPYHPLNYSRAKISFENGKFNSSVRARINFYDNSIVYQGENDQEMELIIPIISIEFRDSVENIFSRYKRFPDVEGLAPNVLYEEMETGKATLLAHRFTTYRDFSPYGTAVITRTFVQKVSYIVLLNDVPQKVGKNNADLTSILNDKRKEMEEYIKSNKLNTRSEVNLKAIVRFYNSLQD